MRKPFRRREMLTASLPKKNNIKRCFPEHEKDFAKQRTGMAFDFSTTSANVFFPTSLPIFQAVNTCPCWKISSTSSSDRPTVSGYMKKMWMKAAKLNVPKIK